MGSYWGYVSNVALCQVNPKNDVSGVEYELVEPFSDGTRGLRFRVGGWGSGFGFRVWGLGFRVWGLGFRVWGLGFRVQDLGFRV